MLLQPLLLLLLIPHILVVVLCTKTQTCPKAGHGKSANDKGAHLRESGMFTLLGILIGLHA